MTVVDTLATRKPSSRALHCYVVLSLWILLLVAGVYKFLEPHHKLTGGAVDSELLRNLAPDVKTRRIFRICNLPEDIEDGDEGNLDPKQWTLKGTLVLIRHGDRGPLQHVRNISYVNCGGNEDQNLQLKSYQEYIHNLTISGRVSWIGPGPFHGFPILPLTSLTKCQLGQLTVQGVAQLLKLGTILRRSYASVWPKVANLSSADVVVYSTRYRRTFQSALAFLYGMISTETLAKITVLESQSMSFCFKDCGCPIADKYFGRVKKYIGRQLSSHPAVAVLAQKTGHSVFSPGAEQGSMGSDPHAIRDALLTYICHSSSLPCENRNNCVKRQNVAGIFAYTDWVNHQKWGNEYWKRYCLLKSYGLIKHIVSKMLHMLSDNGPYLVMYSGHDHTLEQLSTALGLHNDPLLLRYAARIVFEVYRDNRKPDSGGVQNTYFRVLSNGRDVTRQIKFCKEIVTVVGDDVNAALCKIEDIVRYIHDDYFLNLNFTNFKDSCAVT